MSFDQLALEAVINGMGNDDSMADLFGGPEVLKKIRQQGQQQGEARLRVSQAVLDVYNSPAGKILFDYLIGAYIRRFNNITALGLPMETAIQLHAERDGQRELVHDLMSMIHEAQNPARTTST